jgi:hypothetical protein
MIVGYRECCCAVGVIFDYSLNIFSLRVTP